MTHKPHRTDPTYHPGSSEKDVEEEPEWGQVPGHRIGFRDKEGRYSGLTHHDGDWGDEKMDQEFIEHAQEKYARLREKVEKGELLTVVDYMKMQEDHHLRMPSRHPAGWRYVLHTTEDFIKNQQNWPINEQKRDKEKQAREEAEKEKRGENEDEEVKKEHEWRRGRGEFPTHHEAYATARAPKKDEHEGGENRGKKKIDDLRQKYSAQEIAFLQSLEQEKEYIQNLELDLGDKISPVTDDEPVLSIDDADQFTPDNWIPRSPDLVRLTGKHPLNAEPDLSALFDAGLITPSKLHYVRSHAAVPHILWETHRVDVERGKLTLSMDDITQFDSVNIPILMACDGNRRKELNMIRRSKGFDWGPGGASCAYWKGALLRNILLAAGVKEPHPSHPRIRRWVNFEGADSPSEGKYSTCITLDYAMDPTNDVILAYEMNNRPIPPDHGYPVRVMIPGYVGGRCVKWLSKIWVSDKENDSYYHIYDNRVLPSFVTDQDSEFAHTMFQHPSTACYEQNLNSVITKPAQGEKIPLNNVKKGKSYRIQGYAYDGGGNEVQRVEVSLDGGVTWLYCTRKFPPAPVRHGHKFWTWLHWSVDVGLIHLVRAKSITVRCFNIYKNTQPEKPSWNLMGMMNNCWYVVRPEPITDPDTGSLCLMFRHPCEPGTGKNGWMKPSTEAQIEGIKHEVSAPQKKFTREEIEKHSKEDDCWIVINNKVYDATSVLSWHPGGKAPIMSHAGKAIADTTAEFESIHDDYAEQKLSECVIGVVTDKVKNYIQNQAEAEAKKRAESAKKPSDVALRKNRWIPVRLKKKEHISEDTKRYIFALPPGAKRLGLSTGQHIYVGFHFYDKIVSRPYTPTRPILESEQQGTFNLVVKTYFPTRDQPGGTMGNILDQLREGEEVEVKGPVGDIEYLGNGRFTVEGKVYSFDNISLIMGGSGITPGYQLARYILKSNPPDKTRIKLLDANKTEDDILLRDLLEELEREHPDQLQVTHVLSHVGDEWKGERGFVTKEIMQRHCFPPDKRNVALICGPPAMITKAVLPGLREWGYNESDNLFGF
ncbi:hypothetical protein VTO42DRAFT_5702 [Malbranchea cinnamomea]